MREYLLTLLVTAAITYMLTPLVRRLAVKFGAVIPARDRDVHVGPIPRMGGLAIYLGVAAGLLVAFEMVPLRNAFPGSGLIFGLLGAGGLIVLLGIVDDRWGISAIGKLAGQVVAAGILFASGAQLYTFPRPNNHVFILTQNESVVLTILVVVATINAVNFIDGLDGLAAGIVFISAISFFAYYYSLVKSAGLPAMAAPALAAIVLAGGCLGFLPHNFSPARIFMGDTGSMLLGLLLAYVPIQAISQLDWAALNNKANRYAEILPLLLPAVVLVIPYVDMLGAVVRRTRAGMSPLAADKKHLHHRLLEIGHSHRASVLILYGWATIFSAAVVGLSLVTVPLSVLLWTTLAAILALALLSMPKLRWWERARSEAAAPLPPLAPVAQEARPVRLPQTAQLRATQLRATQSHTGPVPASQGQPAADPGPGVAPHLAPISWHLDRYGNGPAVGNGSPAANDDRAGRRQPEPRQPEPRQPEAGRSEPGQPETGYRETGQPERGRAYDWASDSGTVAGRSPAISARDWEATASRASADQIPSVFRPVEPTPVHPLDETMPLPVTKPAASKAPATKPPATEPPATDPAAMERAAADQPGMEPPGRTVRKPAARASGNVVP